MLSVMMLLQSIQWAEGGKMGLSTIYAQIYGLVLLPLLVSHYRASRLRVPFKALTSKPITHSILVPCSDYHCCRPTQMQTRTKNIDQVSSEIEAQCCFLT